MPISAVPFKVMLQLLIPGAFATPVALQSMVEPLSVPCAVPVSFRSLAQVALNEPRAEVAVCSLTFHLKSVQVLGVGIRLDEVQLPSRLPEPACGWRGGGIAALEAEAGRSRCGDSHTDNQLCKFLHVGSLSDIGRRQRSQQSQGR